MRDKLYFVDLPKHALVDTLVEWCVDDWKKNELDRHIARFTPWATIHEALGTSELVGNILSHVHSTREIKVVAKVCKMWNVECTRLQDMRKFKEIFSRCTPILCFIKCATALDHTASNATLAVSSQQCVFFLDATMKVVDFIPHYAGLVTGLVQWGHWLVIADDYGTGNRRQLMFYSLWTGMFCPQRMYQDNIYGSFESLCVHNGELYVLARNAEHDGSPANSQVLIFDHTMSLRTTFDPDYFKDTPANGMAIVDDILCLGDTVSNDIMMYPLETLDPGESMCISGDALGVANVQSMSSTPGRLFVIEHADSATPRSGRRILSIDPHCLTKCGAFGRIADEFCLEELDPSVLYYDKGITMCVLDEKLFLIDSFRGVKRDEDSGQDSGKVAKNTVTILEGFRA